MANKKVVIVDEELKPTVLATLKDKKKTSIFGLIWITFIFAIFIASVYYLPDLAQYVNKYLNKEAIATKDNDNRKVNKDDEEEVSEIKVYDLSSDLVIENGNFKLSNITINNNKLTFSVTNNLDAMLDLSKNNYFISLYNENNTLLERIWLKNIIVTNNNTTDVSFDIKDSSVKKLSLVDIKVDDYPNYIVDESNNSNAILTCKKDYETVEYYLKSNLVYAIIDTYEVPKNSNDYAKLLGTYTTEATNLDKIDGITSSIKENDTSLVFKTTINLYTKTKTENDLKIMYNKDTDAKVMYFELSASGYSCK